jgi:hypothetical protein
MKLLTDSNQGFESSGSHSGANDDDSLVGYGAM